MNNSRGGQLSTPTRTRIIKEQTMQNKRLYIILGISIILVGAAAFIAGRMLNSGAGFRSFVFGGPGGTGQVFISLDDVTPAAELPTTTPEITGLFVERNDNTVIVQTVSFGAGPGGIAENAPMEESNGPKVEVVITGETTVYRETTEFSRPVAGEDFFIQQTVEESTLDYLEFISKIPCHSEGALFATEESRHSVGETLR
jgi:hypothetical protein